MQKLTFSIAINASPAHVWRTLWNDATYRKWTSVFHEGSHAVSDWREGSPIYFLGEEQSGMNSRIARSIPGQFMSFEHLGAVINGVADTSYADALGGIPPQENYTLIDSGNGTTLLRADLDANSDMAAYFSDTFPPALEQVKALAEATPAIALTISAQVHAAKEKVWEYFTQPEHLMQWNNASPDWHTPAATNDLRPGGRFSYTMAARDGNMSFDFGGTYHQVEPCATIAYTLDDGRRVSISFAEAAGQTLVKETFEAEDENSAELQQMGWQAILDNFKTYTETH